MSNRYGLEIRAATLADAPFVAELLTECGHPTPTETLTAALTQIRQSPGTALIAQEYGPPSGIIVVAWHPTLTSPHLTAQITTLLVTPTRRRQGLARLLLKSASQTARTANCDTIKLHATRTQSDLIAFAQATGFIQCETCFTRSLRKK